GPARRDRDPALRKGVRAARDLHAEARRGALASPSPRACVGLRVREPVEHRRRLHPPPTPQDRRAVRPPHTRNRTRRRVPPARRRRMNRLPIRVRVTAAFAAAMAIVLAGSGWFLYARLGSHLETALNRELELRSQDLGALVQQGGTLKVDSGGRFV